MNKIAIVIPAYNCATQLVRVLEKIYSHQLANIEKIYIVDNLSHPEQINILKLFLKSYPDKSKVIFFQNKINLGLGATFKRSWVYLRNSGYDYMIFLHGDDQADIKDLVNFQKESSFSRTQIAFGSRFMNPDLITNYSRKRLWVNIALNKTLGFLTKMKISELGSGLNLYNLNSISNNDILRFSNHITFDLELLIFCIRNKISFTFFPISWKSEDETSTINELEVGLTLLKIIFSYAVLGITPDNQKEPFPIDDGWVRLND